MGYSTACGDLGACLVVNSVQPPPQVLFVLIIFDVLLFRATQLPFAPASARFHVVGNFVLLMAVCVLAAAHWEGTACMPYVARGRQRQVLGLWMGPHFQVLFGGTVAFGRCHY